MPMLKRIVSGALCCLLLCLSFAGCSKKTLGDSPVPLETVTQNSRENRATFEFSLPAGWVSYPIYDDTVGAVEEKNIEKFNDPDFEDYSLRLEIRNYQNGNTFFMEGYDQAIEALFNGETGQYINYIKQSNAELASGLGESEVPSTDYQFQYYRGTYGTIVEVRHSETYQGEVIQSIVCYREDIPYMVTGAFKDSNELSSGDIVPWVADSLKVTEHFQAQSDTSQEK